MGKTMKRFISVVLAAAIMSLSVVTALAAGAPSVDNTYVTVPTVYVTGYGDMIYADKNNPNSEQIYNNDGITKETLQALLSGFKEPLMYGIKTDDWQPYADFFVETCRADLSSCKLDVNGEPSDGSGNDCNQDKNPGNRRWYGGKYDLFSYDMTYDWRLDPFVIADQINDYIQKIKAATGFEKVNIIGRCLGSNMVLTYLYKYGYDDINSVDFYIGLLSGVDLIGSLFSGKVEINPTALQRYLEKKIPDEGNDMMNQEDVSFIKAIVSVMNAINMLGLPIDLVNKVYDEIYQDVIPRMLKYSYGTYPSYWSFVDDSHYNDAKKLVFGGEEEKYAKFIEKIDKFHYEVLNHSTEIIQKGLDQGVNIYNFAKYGGVIAPVCSDAIYCGDGVNTVKGQTFGTVSSKIDRTLTPGYVLKVQRRGDGKYISPDYLIDASGDMLRDHTWFIKGSDHEIMPRSVHVLMANVFEADNYGKEYVTVDHFENYPQFLIASENTYYGTISPMTSENYNDTQQWHKTIFERLTFLFREIFNFLQELMHTIFTEVKK